MKNNLPLPQDKKLTVIVRLEPSCLGPNGNDLIEEFCNFAQVEVETIDSDFVHWELVPRYDKSLPEMQYKAINKKLSHDKASKYLEIFNKSLDKFENNIHQKLAALINQYLGH